MKPDQKGDLYITITAASIVKTLAILVLFYVLFVIRDLLLVLLASIVIASAIEPIAGFFVRHKVPRTLAVIIIYVSLGLILAGLFYVFIPIILSEVGRLYDALPGYIDALDVSGFANFSLPFLSDLSLSETLKSLSGGLSSATSGIFSTVSVIFGGVFSFILIVVISFYLSVQRDGVDNFLKIVTPAKHQKYVINLWERSQKKIGLWMQGQLFLALLVGVLTYVGLTIIGLPNPFLLALLTAVFELIPIFGPILASVPAIGVGLVEGGAVLGLVVAGFYIVIQQFENHLFHPLVVKKIVGIPALVAILSLIIGAQLWGFLGVILSVPIAAAILEYLGDVDKDKKREIEEGERLELELAKKQKLESQK